MESTQQEVQRIRKVVSKSPIIVDKVYKSDYQKEGTLTAQLRQTVTTLSYYPSKAVSNNLQDNIFAAEQFGFGEQEFKNEENRVAWIDVPMGSTVESVTAQLSKFPEAELYRVMSNRPIITDHQKYAIDNNITTLDVFANSQAVRFPVGHPQEGELALDQNSGKVQYRAVFFKASKINDIDKRTSDPTDYYASPEILAEIESVGEAHVIASQSLG